MDKGKLCFLDLFAGAGGLSEGFVQEGFIPVAHIEMDRGACDTLRTRECCHWLQDYGKEEIYRKYLQKKINRDQLYQAVPEEILRRVICETMTQEGMPDLFSRIDGIMQDTRVNHVDLMLGGPPCQAYSVAGRSRKDMTMDPRNYLYLLYLMAVEKYQPDMLVFENVPGILSAGGRSHFLDLQERLDTLGYNMDYKTCYASDYGVLQNRKRIILVAWKKTSGFGYPNIGLLFL